MSLGYRRGQTLLMSVVVLAFSTHGASSIAQDLQAGPQSAPYTLKINARTVTLDVVVTDKRGNLVKNLSQADFSVFDNKAEQKIDYYRVYVPPAPGTLSAPCSTNCLNSKGPDSPVTIIVVDEFSMGFEDEAFATYSLKRFLANQGETLLQPTMLISAKLGKLEVLSDYTTSKDKLFITLKHRINEYPWPTRSGNLLDDQINSSFSAIVALAESTIAHPGRKNVVWIGRGFPAITPGSLDPDSAASLQDALHTCIDLMMQARMTLYTIDPGGLRVNPPVDENGDISSDPLDGQVDFSLIARSTGGKTFAGRNDIDKLIEVSTNEAANFYTIAYTPNYTSAEEHSFHSIRVVMRNPQWKAITRSGYYTNPSKVSPIHIASKADIDRSLYDLDVAARTTLVYDGVPMQIARNASDPDLFTIGIPSSAIRWHDSADGEQTADIYLLAESFDRDSKLIGHTAKLVTARLPSGSTVPRVEVLVQIPTTQPAVRLRFAVRIEATGRVGANNFSLSPKDLSH